MLAINIIFPLTKAASFTVHSNKRLELSLLVIPQVTTLLMLHETAALSFHQWALRRTTRSLIFVYFVFKETDGVIWSQLLRYFFLISYWAIISMDRWKNRLSDNVLRLSLLIIARFPTTHTPHLFFSRTESFSSHLQDAWAWSQIINLHRRQGCSVTSWLLWNVRWTLENCFGLPRGNFLLPSQLILSLSLSH